MVVDYPSMSSADFGVPDFCFLISEPGQLRFPIRVYFVADRLRPAAKKNGVDIEDGQRIGLHDLRHALGNWLVNEAKIELKNVQGILRHAKIQATLELYT